MRSVVTAALWLFVSTFLAQAETDVRIGVIRADLRPDLPISRLDLPADDDGLAGARLGIIDNNTTGRFLQQSYTEVEAAVPDAEALDTFNAMRAEGVNLFVVLAERETLLAMAEATAGEDVILINAQARDNALRTDICHPHLLHVVPSRAMLADGLAQYMIWKRWTDWFLIHGSNPPDLAMAEAYRRAAKKFGAKIVEERLYEDTGGARRSDSGHVLVQRQLPVFTQRARAHDVIVAADETNVFAAYLPYRTWDPSPVAGDAGLVARNWHPGHEGWGATQLQRRFEKTQGRRMSDRDYQAWVGVRVLGEAVTRTDTNSPGQLRDFILSDDFEIAAFKGQGLTFRRWNNQMRNGILLADGKLVVTVSPQEEFLHKNTRLDTLGYDAPESNCNLAE